VPTGRGKIDDEVSPGEYEAILHEVYGMTKTSPIPIRVTCGPHFMRVVAQNRRYDRDQPNLVRPGGNGHGHPGSLDRTSRGCLAGDGYCFISYRGDVTPCGYFPVVAGNVREKPFREIYLGSRLFRSLRDLESFEGKCGVCEFLRVCGGCRARAYSLTGNYLSEEPFCVYQPRALVRTEV
jgi:radical SAM protein with 4Fe4S-binding SPASM domain